MVASNDQAIFCEAFKKEFGYSFKHLSEYICTTLRPRQAFASTKIQLRKSSKILKILVKGETDPALAGSAINLLFPKVMVSRGVNKTHKSPRSELDLDLCKHCEDNSVVVSIQKRPSMGHKFELIYINNCTACGKRWF